MKGMFEVKDIKEAGEEISGKGEDDVLFMFWNYKIYIYIYIYILIAWNIRFLCKLVIAQLIRELVP
jgi:hypothetical protein